MNYCTPSISISITNESNNLSIIEGRGPVTISQLPQLEPLEPERHVPANGRQAARLRFGGTPGIVRTRQERDFPALSRMLPDMQARPGKVRDLVN